MILLLCLIICLVLGLCSQVTPDPEPFQLTLALVLAVIVGLYEVVARLIPTVKQYSVIEKIFSILLWISNFLNNRKKKK